MPSFAGVPIFGAQVVMVTGGTSRDAQRNTFFGVDGTEVIDGGFRSHTTTVKGRLFGLKSAGGVNDLSAAILVFRSWHDGLSHELIDMFNQAWENVRMESFNPDPMVYQTGREYFVTYGATFEHLSRT